MSSDKQALFGAFIRQYQAGLRSYIRCCGVHADSVDDIAQEVFIVAYKQLDKFDQSLNFGHWLRGIARNIVRNEIRKDARHNRIMDERLSHFLIAEFENNYQGSDSQGSEVKALSECINQLPDKSRSLIIKRYSEEQNTHLLSEQFDMSTTAVRLALMRIRNKLKVCLDYRLGYEQQ